MTVLVVDGEGTPSSRLNEAFSRRGVTLSRTHDLSDAEGFLAREFPELVVCTSAAGQDPLAWARSLLEAHPELPVAVMCTGLDFNREQLIDAVRLGLVDLLDLEVDEAELDARLDAALARARRRNAPRRELEETNHTLAAHLAALKQDQRAGRYVQLGMLPPSPMAVDQYRLCHRIVPSLLLSGDFVDYFRITDRHFAFYMADVSGHGASSAFVTVLLKNFSRRLRREYRPSMLKKPGEVLAWLNRELLDNSIDKHVVMFVGIIDVSTNRMAYASAGHFPQAILVSGNEVGFLDGGGKPIGLFADATYTSARVELAPGDSVLMWSDGVLEVMDENSLTEKEQRLLDTAETARSRIDDVWGALGLSSEPGPDDMACLIVTREA